MSNNAKRLIVINTIRKIIDIFLGPFLTSYLFKISTDSITTVSLYNMFCYLIIVIFSFIVGVVIKNKYEIRIFRLGMIFKFIQLVILIALGEFITKYVWILAIISGISTITWSFPLNLFSSTIVSNDEKKEYVVYKTMLTNIVKVIIPVLFGSLISIESFEKTAIIVLILSFIQILLSFKLENVKQSEQKYKSFNLIKEYRKLKVNKNIRQLYKIKFFKGMTYEGALDTAVTLLIIIAFSKDFSLGIITSVISILAVASSYICKKITSHKRMKIAIFISSIVPLIVTIILLFITNKYTIIGYNIIYAFFIQIIIIIDETQTITLTNSKVINDSNRVEAYVLMEIFLGAGRLVSYILLLIVGMLNNFYLLNILIIILTLSILLMGKNLIKLNSE